MNIVCAMNYLKVAAVAVYSIANLFMQSPFSSFIIY